MSIFWTAEKKGAEYFLPGVWGCPPAILIPPISEERGQRFEVNGDSGTSQCITIGAHIYRARQNSASHHHPEILQHIVSRNNRDKESPEEFPYGRGLGVSASFRSPPKIGGLRGLIESISLFS